MPRRAGLIAFDFSSEDDSPPGRFAIQCDRYFPGLGLNRSKSENACGFHPTLRARFKSP